MRKFVMPWDLMRRSYYEKGLPRLFILLCHHPLTSVRFYFLELLDVKGIIYRLFHVVLVAAPLVVMPLMLTVHWDVMVAPNEEPKWALFISLGALLLVAGSVLLLIRCRMGSSDNLPISLSVPGGLFLLFLVGLALGVTYTVNPGEGLNRLAFWCAGGLTLASVAWSAQHVPYYSRWLCWSLVISASLLSGLFWRGYFVDFQSDDYNKFVQFSPIGHFNFTADVLMVLIPLLTWALISGSLAIRMLACGSLVTAGFMLITSGSLGGMGGMGVGALVASILGMAKHLIDRPVGRWRPGKKCVWLSLAALGLIALAAKPILEHMPKEYREQMFVRGEWWDAPQISDLAKAQSLPPLAPIWIRVLPYLGSRTPMWAATAGMVMAHPWRGFGTGSYLYEYPGYSKRYDLFGDYETLGVKVKTNPHNILLQIAAENGLPMMLLFAGLYTWLTVRVMRHAWLEPTAFWLCGVWALWAMGLDAQVNHVFFNPASLFMASLGVGLWAGRLPVLPRASRWSLCKLFRWRLVPMIAVAVGLWLATYPLRWVVSEYYVSQAMRQSTSTPPAPSRDILKSWVNARVWSPTNIQALYGLATAALKLEQNRSAEAYLSAFLKLAPNHSAGLNMMATIKAQSGQLDEAEQYLDRAIRLEPDATVLRENLEAIRKAKAHGAEPIKTPEAIAP